MKVKLEGRSEYGGNEVRVILERSAETLVPEAFQSIDNCECL